VNEMKKNFEQIAYQEVIFADDNFDERIKLKRYADPDVYNNDLGEYVTVDGWGEWFMDENSIDKFPEQITMEWVKFFQKAVKYANKKYGESVKGGI